MRFLIRDVPPHDRHLRWANANPRISILPREPNAYLAHVPRRIRFYVAHDIGQIAVGRQRQQNMNVVNGSTDRQNIKLAIARDAANICPQGFGVSDELCARLCAEYAMNVIEDVRASHSEIAPRVAESFRNRRHVLVCRPRRRARFQLFDPTAGSRPRLTQIPPFGLIKSNSAGGPFRLPLAGWGFPPSTRASSRESFLVLVEWMLP